MNSGIALLSNGQISVKTSFHNFTLYMYNFLGAYYILRGRTGAVVSVVDYGPMGLAGSPFVVALSKSHLSPA